MVPMLVKYKHSIKLVNLYLVIELANYELTFVTFSDHVPYFRKQRHALSQILISGFIRLPSPIKQLSQISSLNEEYAFC